MNGKPRSNHGNDYKETGQGSGFKKIRGNFMVNPFSKLSTIEALEKAEEFLKTSEGVNHDEIQTRRLQFQAVQPRATMTEEGQKIIEGWKELESFLEK